MTTRTGCPDPDQLEQFLLGRLSPDRAGAVEEHVAACPSCAAVLGRLPAVDPLVEAMRTAPEKEACPDLVRVLIRQLKRLASSRETASLPGEPTRTAHDVAAAGFEFLEPPSAPDELGRLGHYRVRELLGSGGMGMVFVAFDPRLKREVALKVVKPGLITQEGMRQRFLREAESVAAVEHENIVAIYEVNEQRGVPYLAMPLLRGESLEERLQRARGPLPVGEVLRVGREAAHGLAAAHERGLVHRDVKPGNLFLCEPGGRVKILDFGLARAVSDEEQGGGGQDAVVGTPAYMAPEQAAGHPPDARSDLFSLGCVLYRMATGRAPFDGPHAYAVLVQVHTQQPASPEKLNPALPAELARLIVRLLAKKPADRPASAGEVAGVLARLEEAARRASRRRWLALSFAGGGMVAAAALAAWHLLSPPPPAPPPGEVTFRLDEPAPGLVLVHGGEERPLDLIDGLRLTLEAGDYELRPADEENALRRPVPDRFTLRPGLRLAVPLRLVGEVRKSHSHFGTVHAVAVSPGKGLWVLSAGEDRTVGVWDATGDGRPQYLRHPDPVRAVAVAPDGVSAALAGGGKGRRIDLSVRLFDVQTLRETANLTGHNHQVHALAFSPDGKRLASGARDGVVFVWDTKTQEKVHRLLANDREGVFGLAFSPDGKRLLTAGGDGRVVAWDAQTGKELFALTGHTKEVRGVAWGGPDEASSASLDGTVRLWDLKAKKARLVLEHKVEGKVTAPVLQAVFTPFRGRVLAAGGDGKVRLWDASTGDEVHCFDGHKGAVHGVACAADGRKAVSGGQDGTVRLWELPR